jgi:hypothetical protein
MGLTWITGVLVFHEVLIPVAYIFAIFVAFEVTVDDHCHHITIAIVEIPLLSSVGCCHICLICGGIQAGMILQSMHEQYIALHMIMTI